MMSFLHGVLQSVRDDESVTTYNNMLDSGSRLDNVLRDLCSLIGSGRVGLSVSVTKVKEWLGNYNDEVDSKTKAVTDGLSVLIGKLSSDISSGAGMYYTQVSRMENDKLQDQLKAWQETLPSIFNDINNIEYKHINSLDSALKHKLNVELRPIKEAVKMLGETAKEAALVAQINVVDETLATQFDKIYKMIGELRNVKDKQFRIIMNAIEMAEIFLKHDFDRDYGCNIIGNFGEIQWELIRVYGTLEYKTNEIERFIRQARTEFETLKSKVGDNAKKAGDNINGNWNTLKSTVTEALKKINNDKVRDRGALQKIIEGMKTYGWKFNKDTFTKKVEEWIKDISMSHAVVQHWLGEYVGYIKSKLSENTLDGKLNEGNNAFDEPTIKQIASAIVENIQQQIGDAFTSITNINQDGIEKIGQVKEACESFAGKLNQKIKEGEVDGSLTFAADIAKAIEAKVLGIQDSDDGNYFLQFAVKALISSLYGMSQKFASELQSFLTTSTIKVSLQEAIASSNSIETEFNKSGNDSHGQKIDAALQTIGQKITELDKLLVEQQTDQQGSIQQKLADIQIDISTLYGIQRKDGTIERKRNEAETKMQQLKRKIKFKIHDILEASKNANAYVKTAIDNVEMAARTAHQTITKQIRSLFTNQKLADLSALHKLVERQAKKIKDIIDKDLANGIKGLLSRMQSHHPTLSEVPRLEEFTKASTTTKWYMDYVTEYIKYQLLPDTKPPTPTTPVPPPISGGGYTARPAATTVDPKKNTDEVPAGRVGVAPKITSQPSPPTVQPSPSPSTKNPIEKFFDGLDMHTRRLFSALSGGFYSKTCASYCDLFTNFLHSMRPTKFAEHDSPLLDVLKSGLQDFLEQLSYAYVNTYEGHPSLVEFTSEADGKNCAKTFLSLLETLFDDLGRLKKKCNRGWKTFRIHRGNEKLKTEMENPLGHFFQKCGYEVAGSAKLQNGHLRNEKKFTGEEVYKLIAGESLSHVFRQHGEGPFDLLHEYLQDYYAVGHIATSFATKPPCSVYEMLLWCAGLTHNSVYSALLSSISEKLEEPDNPLGADTDGLVAFDMKDTFLNTYPHKVTYGNFENLLDHICSKSSSILTTVLGTGDEDTVYACDFYDNSMKLYYPKSGAECLDALLDILRRMFPPLRFLFFQCRVGESDYGWGDCHFGKNITQAKWQCTKHSKSESNCQPTCQSKCQANSKPNCQPTSPLQSYLTDSLVGCLPHQLSGIGCKPKCTTCPGSKPGMPCLTPLGFRGISGITRRGEDLSNVLRNLFGDTYLSSLFCLAPKAPSTLPEHFGFALSLVNKWNDRGSHPIKDAVKKAIDDRSISLYEEASTLTTALSNAYGSSQISHDATKYHTTSVGDNNDEPKKGSLSSLCMATACSNALCAPYVYTLCSDYYTYLGKSHSKLYLSWAIYLPWSLWSYLESLYNAIKDIFCQDWGCSKCLNGNKCRRGQHGLVDDKTNSANCHCDSMVQCRGMMPTLYNPLVALAPVPAARRRRPPRRPEDTLPPEIARKPPHRRAVPPRRRTRQGTRQRQAAREKALGDIDARRISLGQLAGQLSGFIGKSEEVKNALVKGLHSNVNQLSRLLEASCGGEGCCNEAVKFRDVKLTTLRNKFNDIDKIEREIDGLKNEIAEKRKASGGTPSGSGPEIEKLEREIQQKNQELQQKNEELKRQIDSLKNALDEPEKEIDEYIKKLTASVKQCEEDIKQYKKDEKQKNNLKDDKNISIPYSLSHPLETEQAKLQSHKASLESLKSLEKLIEFHQNAQTKNGEECKDILDKLCSGLQTFLGFNPSSKGYDGEGIVYSDLDRLCDGVMSFLHGVLDNIKPKLGQHKTQIDSALTSLKSTNDNGITKYKAAIAEVVKGVRKYTNYVKTSSEDVKRQITTFQGQVKETFDAEITEIPEGEALEGLPAKDVGKHVSAVGKLASVYVQCGNKFEQNMKHRQAKIDDLNSDLKVAISHVRENIKHETARLRTLSSREESALKATIAKIKEALNALKVSVIEKIREKINELVEGLKRLVTSILDILNNIDWHLKNNLKDLKKWIQDADEIVVEAINDTRRIMDERHCGWLSEVKIKDNANKVKHWKDELDKYITSQKQEIKNKVENAKETEVKKLETWKGVAGKVVEAADAQAVKIGEMVKQDDPSKGLIHKLAQDMQTKAESLRKAAIRAKNAVEQQVGLVQKVLKELDAAVRMDLKNVKTSIKKDIEEVINKYVKQALLKADELENVYKQKLVKIQKGVDATVGKDSAGEGILKKLTDLDDDVKRGLVEVRDTTIKGKLGPFVRDLFQKVMEAANDAEDAWNRGSNTKGFEKLKRVLGGKNEEYKNLLHLLNGNKNGLDKSLESILHGIKTYLSTHLQGDSELVNAISNDIHEVVKTAFNKDIITGQIKFDHTFMSAYKLKTEISGDGDHRGDLRQEIDKIKKHVEDIQEQVDGKVLIRNFKEPETPKKELTVALTDITGKDFASALNANMPDIQVSSDGKNTQTISLARFPGYISHISHPADPKLAADKPLDGKLPQAIDKIKNPCLAALSEVPQQDTFQTPFQSITGQLTAIANILDSSQITRHPTKKIGVRNYLEELSLLIDKGEEHTLATNLEPHTSRGRPSTFSITVPSSIPGLMKIKDDITGALDGIDTHVTAISITPTTEALESLSSDITSNLAALIKAFTAIGKKLNKDVTTLKTKIGVTASGNTAAPNTLQIIYDELDKLQKGPVTKAIKDANEFIKVHAPTLQEKCIQELENHVTQEVSTATTSLTAHAQKQYIAAVRNLLTDFVTKVRKELEPLPGKINEDLEQGHKKFMKTFGEKFVNKVNGIKSIDSYVSAIEVPQHDPQKYPLGKATKMLNEAFRGFFADLSKQTDFTSDFHKVQPTKESFAKLLDGLTTSEHFDKRFTRNLEELDNVLGKFKPSEFGEAKSPLLLESLRHGFTPLVTELKKAYVNCYSGRQWYESEQGRYAKVFCSITPILHNTLEELKEKLESEWKEYKIYNPDASHHSLHKLFFRENGYDFGLPDDVPNGELNHRADCTPGRILSHLTGKTHKLFAATRPFDVSSVNGDDAENLKIDVIEGESLLEKLYSLLHDYFNVCHTTHIDKPRTPCNIYEMLLWCSGLQFNRVYHPLLDHVRTLFPVDDESQPPQKILQPIVAYPHNFTREDACSAIEHVSENAYLLLTGILGTGDAECNYASDFSTNFLKLKYPSRGEDCLHTLLDILRRLFPVLNFMHTQCTIPSKHCGWRDCLYGNGVGPSSWQCKEHSNTQPTDQPNSKPTCQANTKPNCQPTSPLMSYLNDCLPGHLPHRLESVGCKSECKTCPSSTPGMPCLTPLGFRGFSGSTKTGKDICRILGQFFSDIYLPTLFTLVPKPPKTLPEHFGFALSLANVINDNRITNVGGTTTFKNTFIASIDEQSIELCDEPTGLTDALTAAYSSPSAPHSSCDDSHLMHLTTTAACKGMSGKMECSPYLSTLCDGAYLYLAEKHSKLYLSFSIYLPWQFWSCLNNLYEAFLNIYCQYWGCSKCLRGEQCKKGSHGSMNDDTKKPSCSCSSLVQCRGVSPTLYKYGFRFGAASLLNNRDSPKTCSDFCKQLKHVLHSQYFSRTYSQNVTNSMDHSHTLLLPVVSPLVAVAPVPAAHHRRPPRRAEDTLPPEIALKPPDRRAVPPRRRTRQGTRQRQVLLAIIVPSPTHSPTQPLNHPITHSTTHSTTHSLHTLLNTSTYFNHFNYFTTSLHSIHTSPLPTRI
ncbi:hypothetical protein, conserved [Babesia ovata]|uniref:C3H1-type domain-containing protein n=1 Tax=Babesia ovata TaxID=189622 RepID=A0A2H6KAE7_9APIC|nr:uncharacterized protein BOVATA_014560 [Babesia ovata]GBE59963.1 hypothetical protein, conserved [Babesia ovata]